MNIPVEVRAILMGLAVIVLYHALGGGVYGTILAGLFLITYLILLRISVHTRR